MIYLHFPIGYVTPSSSLAFGFFGALCCNFAMSIKKLLRVDDAYDVFACHCVGGIVGNILTGVFAQRAVAAVDGQHIHGGWLALYAKYQKLAKVGKSIIVSNSNE